MKHIRAAGFTIVEVMVVVVILGILASLTAFSFGNWQSGMAKNEVKSDLIMAGTAMNASKNFSSAPLTSVPSTFNPSKNIIIEPTDAPTGQYCINAYHTKYTSLRMSIRTGATQPEDGLCPWPASGNTIGGTVPAAPTNVNIALGFDEWTVSGTTAYNSSTKHVAMGTNGTITSPMTRVNGASSIAINAQFYATAQSAQASLQPNGGWHINIAYFGSDGVTPVQNTAGYTANGCARTVQLSSWNSSLGGTCSFALGNGIEYTRVIFYSSASGYSSTDLQIRNPSFVIN